MSIHLLSPILYAGYVHLLQKLPALPSHAGVAFLRKLHNINLSVWSAIILGLAVVAQFQTSKFASVDAFLCDSYEDNSLIYIACQLFLYSKYVEWGDTAFLHLSGKPISMLQYTHHMSTAFLTYVAIDRTIITPHMLIFIGTNTLVHIPMYWYFAYPKGFLHKYRKMITQSQIVQHIVCLGVIIYTSVVDDCSQAELVNQFGMAMYSMYLFYFVMFYANTYSRSKVAPMKDE